MFKERSDVGAAVTISPAGELGLEIGKPDVITQRPASTIKECAHL
jgi:hypothetical protein